MTQSFPNVKGSDYIDTGIMRVQERDNASLTLFWGPTPVYGAFRVFELKGNKITNPTTGKTFGILEDVNVKGLVSERLIGNYISSFQTQYVYDKSEEIIGYFQSGKILSFSGSTIGVFSENEHTIGDETVTLAEIETYLNYQCWLNSQEPHELKFWNPTNESWELIINPKLPPVKEFVLSTQYQMLNENLTQYSKVEIPEGDKGLIVNGEFIPVGEIYITGLSYVNSIDDFKKVVGIGTLAEKSIINSTSLENNSIPKIKISKDIIVDSPFVVGDTIISLVNRVKDGFVRLSPSDSQTFTVGNISSSSTYKGDSYFNLFRFVWEKLNTKIFTSSGGTSSKGSSAENDWLSNKRLSLPSAAVPNSIKPSIAEVLPNTTTPGSYEVSIPKGIYRLMVVGAGGGCGARNTKSDHKGPGGAGGCGGSFDAYVDLPAGAYSYTIGEGGEGSGNSHGTTVSLAYSGKDGTASKFGDIAISDGGTGGKGYRTSGYKDNDYYGYSRNESIGGQGGKVTVLNRDVIREEISVKTGANASGSNGGSDGKDYTRNVAGEGYMGYGQGNAYNGGWDGTALQKTGGNGFVSLRFIAPLEYDTTDSNEIKNLDNLYNGLNFYMKY